MVTKHEALTEREFHWVAGCERTVGPKGGIKARSEVWRVTGKPKTWVRDAGRWIVPVKHGLYQHAHLTNYNAEFFVVASKCPVCHPGEGV